MNHRQRLFYNSSGAWHTVYIELQVRLRHISVTLATVKKPTVVLRTLTEGHSNEVTLKSI